MRAIERTSSRIDSLVVRDVLERIDGLTCLMEIPSRRASRRAQKLRNAIEDAHVALLRGDFDELASAVAALDFLSFELCNE